ncbi:MAG TPA: DNA methyltransferase [Kofleriaceae bacterium]|nr:DNA methyltransferase [Kofleriaceae bacterium]
MSNRPSSPSSRGPRPAPAGKQRRALSMPRAPGRIDADGDRRVAEGLVTALRAAALDDVVADSLTHPVHSYPARMHPATVRVLVEIVADAMPRDSVLVDPFCGSGTTLVEARAAGLRTMGIDLNPLAVLLARAKTWIVPSKSRARLRLAGRSIGGEALMAGKEARRSGGAATTKRAPAGFDPNARDRRIGKWFAPHVRRELEDLAMRIDEVRQKDPELADVLMVPLSSILYKVSSRTSDTNPEWVARNIGRGQCARLFSERVEMLSAGLDDLYKAFGRATVRGAGGPPDVHLADARRLTEFIPAGRTGGIVTSPPYAGTYDYAEHQRLRFDFLGLRHREFDDGEIGSRRSFATGTTGERKWRTALAETLDSFALALAPGARAAIVIGDSFAGGRATYALDDVRGALSDAFYIEAWASQERPMLGAGERKAFGERPKAEHAIVLRRRDTAVTTGANPTTGPTGPTPPPRREPAPPRRHEASDAPTTPRARPAGPRRRS